MKRRPYKEVLAEVQDFDKKLLATDERFCGSVQLHHQDGSSFHWNHAFIVKIDSGHWLAVFTEHHGPHLYDADDVTWFRWYPSSKKVPYADWQKDST
jgi:hypothetical protein